VSEGLQGRLPAAAAADGGLLLGGVVPSSAAAAAGGGALGGFEPNIQRLAFAAFSSCRTNKKGCSSKCNTVMSQAEEAVMKSCAAHLLCMLFKKALGRLGPEGSPIDL
jgi:hypothetical protein